MVLSVLVGSAMPRRGLVRARSLSLVTVTDSDSVTMRVKGCSKSKGWSVTVTVTAVAFMPKKECWRCLFQLFSVFVAKINIPWPWPWPLMFCVYEIGLQMEQTPLDWLEPFGPSHQTNVCPSVGQNWWVFCFWRETRRGKFSSSCPLSCASLP